MSLIEQIKKDQLVARKRKDKLEAALLTTLIGELTSDVTGLKGKVATITDTMVLSKIKKFTKALNILKATYQSVDMDKYNVAESELLILARYTPKQLNLQELEDIISAIVAKEIEDVGVSTISSVMSNLKENYSGMYEGKDASRLARELA